MKCAQAAIYCPSDNAADLSRLAFLALQLLLLIVGCCSGAGSSTGRVTAAASSSADPRPAFMVGADATIYPGHVDGIGGFDLNRTIAALTTERVRIFSFEKAFRCSNWRLLDQVLEAAQVHGIVVVAGLESHGATDLHDYCDNFRVGGISGNPINWSSTFQQLAQKSVVHPNLIGARMDDFVHSCAVQAYRNKDVVSPWEPADVAHFIGAAKAVNPSFAFLPIFYYWQLGQFSPFSYSFGGHVSPPLLEGASARMRVIFHVPPDVAASSAAASANLTFLEFADTYATSQGELLPRGLVRRSLGLNGVKLLDDDVAVRPDAYFGIFDACVGVGGLLHSGPNVLEFRVAGVASAQAWAASGYNASRSCSHCSNSVNVWDLSLVVAGSELLGDRVNVSFVLQDAPGVPGAVFGGGNADLSSLKYTDGVLSCYMQWESHGNWSEPTAANPELKLYRRLLDSMRRALDGDVDGRVEFDSRSSRGSRSSKKVYATHFGASNWAPGSPFARHHMDAGRQAALLAQDLVHADGSFAFWDVLGLGSDVQQARGVFSRHASTRKGFPLLLRYSFESPVMHGFYQRLRSQRTFVGLITIRMQEAATGKWSLAGGFNTSISAYGKTVYSQPTGHSPCRLPDLAPQIEQRDDGPRPCPGASPAAGPVSCSVQCEGSVETVRMALPSPTVLSLSMDAATGGMQNTSWWCAVDSAEAEGGEAVTSPASEWSFSSDVAQYVKDVHATFVNLAHNVSIADG